MRRYFLHLSGLLALAASLTACRPTAEADISGAAALRELTGAPSRMVWVEQVDGKGDDPFATGHQLRLMGLDTEDGRGERAILSKVGNYRKPLITPDGQRIVYSDFHSRSVHVVDWSGRNHKKLWTGGIATEVWRDPQSGRTWVYAVDNQGSKKKHEGRPVIRFDIDAPSKQELVWDLTLVNPDNFQLTRDGAHAAGLFPWSSAGIAKLPNGGFRQVGKGCWTSMCPDNSGVMWIFDGMHKNLLLHTGEGAPTRNIPVNTMPDGAAHEVYHPRWSNHPRFFAITGPYRQRGAHNNITGGGSDIHVYAGRFDADTTRVEAWAKVSTQHNANFFPDLWVQGGEKIDSGFKPEKPSQTATGSIAWPGDRKGLVFLWEHAKATNEVLDPVTGRPGYCRIVRTGHALFGRFQELILGKGAFAAQEIPLNPSAEIARTGAFTLELTLTPDTIKARGTPVLVLSNAQGEPNLALIQVNNRILIQARSNGKLEEREFAYIRQNVPNHLVATFDGKRLFTSIHGQPALEHFDFIHSIADWTPGTIHFGTWADNIPLWKGRMEGIAIFNRALNSATLAARHEDFSKRFANRPAAHRMVAECTLLETSPARAPEDLAGYRHDLVEYKYRIDKVTEGNPPDGTEILVQHWSILDLQSVLQPREVGKTYTLTLEPVAEHPELEGERVSTEMTDLLDPWLDVGFP